MASLIGRFEAMVDRRVHPWTAAVWVEDGPPRERLEMVPGRVFAAILRLVVVAVILQTVAHLADAVLLDLRIDRLNADLDSSVWGWTGVTSEFAATLGAALLALLATQHRRALTFLTAALAFLSLDDGVQIHERLGGLVNDVGPLHDVNRMTWPILYAPLMLAVFILLWKVSGAFVPGLRGTLRWCLVLLGLAVCLEFSTPLLFAAGSGKGDLGYEFEVAVEEAFELAGWSLIAGALLASGLDVMLRAARQRDRRDDVQQAGSASHARQGGASHARQA